jgi:hypothetical protein
VDKVKKLYCFLRGGLGNQLFIYAACYASSKRNGFSLTLDCHNGFSKDKRYRRNFALNNFLGACQANKVRQYNIIYWMLLNYTKIRKKLSLKSKYLHQHCGHSFDDTIHKLSSENDLIAIGLWQGEAYFEDVSDCLRQQLISAVKPNKETQELIQQLKENPIIGVHIRDYESDDAALKNALSNEYFRHSIDELRAKYTSNIQVWVCSNNLDYASKLLKGVSNVRLVKISANNADFWEMQILSMCKFFIGSHSTFSWWCAWLNEEYKDEIIFPDLILSGEVDWGFAGLIPERWILKKC